MVHVLIHHIKDAWRKEDMASIPLAYVQFISNLLQGQKSKLKFDDFTSQWIKINNGIGQGDPLSMIIYILYNADLIEIARKTDEDMIRYVDDAIVVAMGKTFEDTTRKIHKIMTRREGAFDWSKDYNLNFELSKLAIMHCTQSWRQRDPNTGQLA